LVCYGEAGRIRGLPFAAGSLLKSRPGFVFVTHYTRSRPIRPLGAEGTGRLAIRLYRSPTPGDGIATRLGTLKVRAGLRATRKSFGGIARWGRAASAEAGAGNGMIRAQREPRLVKG